MQQCCDSVCEAKDCEMSTCPLRRSLSQEINTDWCLHLKCKHRVTQMKLLPIL